MVYLGKRLPHDMFVSDVQRLKASDEDAEAWSGHSRLPRKMFVTNSSPRDSYRMCNRVRATALMVNAMLSHAS
jgi:hypothetical protein